MVELFKQSECVKSVQTTSDWLSQHLFLVLVILGIAVLTVGCNSESGNYTDNPLHDPNRLKSVIDSATRGSPACVLFTEEPQQIWGKALGNQVAHDLVDVV